MELAVLREPDPRERRVAVTPHDLPALKKLGIQIRLESGAGEAAGYPDEAYHSAGAVVLDDPGEALKGADLWVAVQLAGHPGSDPTPAHRFPQASVAMGLVGFEPPADWLRELEERRVTLLSLERLPRITRAQSMDVLSSQATVSGYLSVLRAATHLPRFLPMLTTAAGTIRPARVLVMGAGVAGLQAIATARRLGSVVTGYDIRPAAREQIRSLGAQSLEEEDAVGAEGEGGYARSLSQGEQERQMEFLARSVPQFDVVITTAQIPGKAAPTLVTVEMVEAMSPGSVIMDLAAETGGNCPLSRPGEIVKHGGVTLDAPVLLPSGLPGDASRMFGRNVTALLRHMVKDGNLVLDMEDEITSAIAVTLPQEGNDG
ncbi:MAG: NAD(P) transhydrogenase subunit alpha [Gemmatimonadota bacterium]